MFLRQLDLTTALRPSLLPEEVLLFVQDAVGLYEGKYKIPSYQQGQAYLTSHRVCYVDNAEPRKASVAIDLKDVDHPEFYAGFLKSSPKITLFPKAPKRQSLALRSPAPSYSGFDIPTGASSPTRYGTPVRPAAPSPAPARDTNATWICPICSFSNPVPSNFDPATANAHTPLPPCLACGIKPPLVHVVKAAIAAMSNRPSAPSLNLGNQNGRPGGSAISSSPLQTIAPPTSSGFVECPRCTFQNHPSLPQCEMCGASLPSSKKPVQRLETIVARAESPGPSLQGSPTQDSGTEVIKLSFRAGGEKVFHERLKGALIQRKWLLTNAPPIPQAQPDTFDPLSPAGFPSPAPHRKQIGIAGLERRGQELRKNNEIVIGSAFEDLEALMTSAKEVIAMAERFASQSSGNGASAEASALLSESASALGLVTTKDMLGTGSSSESLYITELSRNVAEFLTDDKRGILRREGGIMSLVDLWAIFNRTRNGIELISPLDFEKAAQRWDQLRLPIRLRRFKSGLLVVQGRDRTDDKTVAALLAWLKEMHDVPPDAYMSDTAALTSGSVTTWDWRKFGRGVTAQEVAERFSWSVGVASEELEMAEEKGALCREQGVDGVKFWENAFMLFEVDLPRPVMRLEDLDQEALIQRLEDSGLI